MRISIPHGCDPCAKPTVKWPATVSNVLALMDEDPDFTYAMSSANSMRGWNRNTRPVRAHAAAHQGRRFIPVGGMWVESDNMLPTGESLIRQITFGMRYFREHLGVEPKGLWLPDSFGYCGAWPQIARRAGFEWFLTQKILWNDTTKFPHHSFEWAEPIPRHSSRIGDRMVHRQARADYVRDIARLRDIAAEAGASIASVRMMPTCDRTRPSSHIRQRMAIRGLLAPRQWERR